MSALASPGARVRVAVIGGGQNCEHDVSVASAASVRAALDPTTYETVALTIARDGTWLGSDGQPLGWSPADSLAAALRHIATCRVVLPLVHGPRGEDGALAALCELAGVPYVGSPVRAGALAMDKWATKLVAEAVGVRTAPGRLVTDASAAVFDGPVPRMLAALGVVSYGAYLWNYPLTLWLRPSLGAMAGPLAAALTIGVAALSWRFVEEPVMRRRPVSS